MQRRHILAVGAITGWESLTHQALANGAPAPERGLLAALTLPTTRALETGGPAAGPPLAFINAAASAAAAAGHDFLCIEDALSVEECARLCAVYERHRELMDGGNPGDPYWSGRLLQIETIDRAPALVIVAHVVTGSGLDVAVVRQLLRDHRGGHIEDLPGREAVRTQRQRQDRCLRGIDLVVLGHARHAAGQLRAGGVDGRLHVARGAVHVAAQIKLQGDAGATQDGARGDFVDPGDGAQRPLQRGGDGGGHGVGAGAGQAGADGDGGVVDLGQRGDGQEEVRHRAHQGQAQGEEHGGDGAVDEGGGEAHGTGLWVLRCFWALALVE